MKYFLYLFFFLFSIGFVNAQDSTASLAYKSNKPEIRYPLVKPKGHPYPLISGFALIKEANEGDPYAEHELGIRYLQGMGFETDTAKAIYWIKKAADQNLITAKFNLGIFAMNGIGIDWDPFYAHNNFRETAYSGFPAAQLAYGLSFIHNLVVNQNLDSAYKWIKKSREGNYEPAEKVMASLLESGYTPPDSSGNNDVDVKFKNEKASAYDMTWDYDFINFDEDTSVSGTKSRVVELFSEGKEKISKTLHVDELEDSTALKDTSLTGIIDYAADLGGPDALMMRGLGYEYGHQYGKNTVKAMMNYLIAVRNGSNRAGLLIYEMMKDDNTIKVIEKQANAGNTDAKFVWAALIAFGYDYSILLNDAINLLEEAADKDHIPALIELGILYYNGDVVNKDHKKAYSYWDKAANLGSLEAEVRLAINRIFNHEYTKDELAGLISQLQNARNKGLIIAETALGYCYENGIGVKKDLAYASQLYWDAASKGNHAGFISLKKLYDTKRPDEDEFIIYEQSNY